MGFHLFRTHRGTFLRQVWLSQLHRCIRYRTEKQTDTQTNAGEKPNPRVDNNNTNNYTDNFNNNNCYIIDMKLHKCKSVDCRP